MWREVQSGSIFQDICNLFGIYEPVNGSWIQALCWSDNRGELLAPEPINGSWELAFLKANLDLLEIEFNENTIINGNIWQTFWVVIDGATQMEGFGFPNIDYPINGSWENNFLQLSILQFENQGGGKD